MRLVALLAHDSATGLATLPVGVAGTDGDAWHVSWIPYRPAGDSWRERISSTPGPFADAIDAWAALADGLTWDLASIEAPSGVDDVPMAVEAVLDALLAAGTH